MLEIRTRVAKVKLEIEDVPVVLSRLSEKGWEPAILQSERYFVRLAGVEDAVDPSALRRSVDRYTGLYPSASVGDVFFKDSDVYYIANSIGGDYLMDEYGRRIAVRDDNEPSLEIGVISLNSEDLEDCLDTFASTVEAATKLALDGRKVRHMKFDWRDERPKTPRLDRLTGVSEEESQAAFVRADLDDEQVSAAEALHPKLAREILIELSEARFARERDVLSRRSKLEEKVKDAIGDLKDKGLVTTEYLLECRNTGAHLTRLRNREQLNGDVASEMRCPSCNRSFGEEVLSEGYSVSELGQTMIRKSHWMTVWVTALLTKLGVPTDAILWNVTEDGEEVDLLVELLGQVWIFELKAREFGAGDATALNYRRVRYGAAKTVVVTTEKVSRDAKRVFTELQREPVTRRRGGEGPVYVEGLDKAPEVLRRELSSASLGYARRKISVVGAQSGYNLGAVLAARFGEPVGAREEDEIETVIL